MKNKSKIQLKQITTKSIENEIKRLKKKENKLHGRKWLMKVAKEKES